jgi:hypothetical protein
VQTGLLRFGLKKWSGCNARGETDSSFIKLQVGKGGLHPPALNVNQPERGQAILPNLQIELT